MVKNDDDGDVVFLFDETRITLQLNDSYHEFVLMMKSKQQHHYFLTRALTKTVALLLQNYWCLQFSEEERTFLKYKVIFNLLSYF